ncbi:MAG: 50S ribosomal protein L29 [Myxococcota bacterium]
MKASELNGLSDEQLVHKELELERNLLAATFRHRLNQLENTSVLGKTRKDIARAETVLRTREVAQGLPKGALKAKHASSFVPPQPEAGGEAAGAGFLKGILDKGEQPE